MEKNEAYDKRQKAYNYAVQLKQPYDPLFKEVCRLVQPEREPRLASQQLDDQTRIFDTTATLAVRQLVSHTVEFLVPQNRAWAKIKIKTKKHREQLETAVAQNLIEWNDALNQHFIRSNFYLALSDALNDAILIGTGCIAVVDRVGSELEYMAVPFDQIYFTQSATCKVDMVFRKQTLTGRNLLDLYKPLLSEEKRTECEDFPEKEFNIVECVEPYGFRYMHSAHFESEWDQCIFSQEVELNPYIVWRWDRTLNNTWGNSPVRTALPDIQTLNKMKEDYLVAVAFAARPAYQIETDMQNLGGLENQVLPGNLIATPQGAEIKALPMSSNFPVTMDIIRSYASHIMDMLYATTLSQNPVENKYMTATEVAWRRQLFYSQAGGPARRLEKELLRPIVAQIFSRMIMRGDIEAIPGERIRAFNLKGVNDMADLFEVDTDAAIFRALKSSEAHNDLESIGQIAQVLAQLQQAGPAMTTVLNVPEVVRNALEGKGVSIDAIYSRKQTAEFVKQMQEAQAAQAQQQQAMEAAKVQQRAA